MSELNLQSTARLLSVLIPSSSLILELGRTIPLLGLGVYQNRDNCASACLAALKAGYRHIDSAQYYPSKVVSWNQGYEKTIAGVNESLQNFGLNYLDLFLIHDPLAGKEKRLATWKALIALRDEGKLLNIGVSNYGVHHLEEIKSAGLETPSINQIELHPWCQQKPIVEYCKKNGIVVQAYSPLVQARSGFMDHPVLVEIAKKHGKESAQVLIRWSLQMGHVVLPKSEKESRIISNADIYDFTLDEEDMFKLNALDLGDKGAVDWNPVNAS
ncbi:Aldo/keto reductase [Auriculariales sp. MPI-PUGE-AT-0066]|nr:Aldo/keto reductase [Auriculariales sp. MPI-PUGE-AT-0066]